MIADNFQGKMARSRTDFILSYIITIVTSSALTSGETFCQRFIYAGSQGSTGSGPTSGIIKSNYGDPQECTYKVIAPSGSKIKLDFSYGSFRLYHGRKCVLKCSETCDHIQLNNYELRNNYVNLLKSCFRSNSGDCLWCGVPPPSISKTNWISFRARLTSMFSKLLVKWTVIDEDPCVTESTINAAANSTLIYHSRYLQNNSGNCQHTTFKVVGPKGKRIKLHFTSFRVGYATKQNANACTPKDDYIQLKNYDVEAETFYNHVWQRSKTCSPFACEYIWCDKKNPPPMMSKTNVIYIHAYFTRNSSFTARWDIIQNTPDLKSGTSYRTAPRSNDLNNFVPTKEQKRRAKPITKSEVKTINLYMAITIVALPLTIVFGIIAYITYRKRCRKIAQTNGGLFSRTPSTARGITTVTAANGLNISSGSARTLEVHFTSETTNTCMRLPQTQISEQTHAQIETLNTMPMLLNNLPGDQLPPAYDLLGFVPSEPPPPYSPVCSAENSNA